MSTTLAPKQLPKPASQIGAAFKKARTDAGLSRAAASARIGVDAQTLLRWEHEGVVIRAELESVLRAESVYGVSLIPMIRERLGIDVPRGTIREARPSYSPGESAEEVRFPLPFLMRSRPVRGFLATFRSELVDRGATAEQEESAMRTLEDRGLIARFAGGSTDDSYTEAQILQALGNIAEAARRFLAGPGGEL